MHLHGMRLFPRPTLPLLEFAFVVLSAVDFNRASLEY